MKKIDFNEEWQFWKEYRIFSGRVLFLQKNFMAEIAWQGKKVLLSFGNL